MIELQGVELYGLPVQGLEKVRDLEYFEGPLLSHFHHARGDHYLWYWCDCDNHAQRWMMLRVSETNILRLVNRFVPLDYVIPKQCQDDFVYFVDSGAEGRPVRTFLTAVGQIPENYVPRRGAYLDFEGEKDERSYAVLIERNLSINDLREFPTRYEQAYALLFLVNVLQPNRFEGYPWRGGFSSMHFYRWILDKVPGEHRPSVARLQYASPGFIRFRLHRPTAAALADCINKFVLPYSPAEEAYTSLKSYISEHKLNDLRNRIADTTDPGWRPFDGELHARTAALLKELGIDAMDIIMSAAPSRFEAAKIASSFAVRIKELALLVRNGLIRLPPD